MSNTGIVVAGHPSSADAGAAILRAGGNAVDAAIAAISTSFCAEPVLTSAGGGGFMLIADSKGKSQCYDGFARMPAAAAIATPSQTSPEQTTGLQAIAIDFGDSMQTFHIGSASVGTPSLLAMLFKAHQLHGKIPLQDALAPGMDAAKNGIRLNTLQASFIQLLQPILSSTPRCQALHAPNNTLLTAGDYFHNTDLANTLDMLIHEGIDEMYHGDLARHIVAACMPYGLLSMRDMQAEQVQIRQPLSSPLFGGTLLTNPPPSTGGLLISFAASLLESLSQHDAAQHITWPTRIAEVLRLASHIRGDNTAPLKTQPGQTGLDRRIHDSNIAADIMHPDHLQYWFDHIIERLQHPTDDGHHEHTNRHGSTTHISIMDKDGLAVSLTSSNGILNLTFLAIMTNNNACNLAGN